MCIRKNKSRFSLKKLTIVALIALSVPLTLTGCQRGEMTAEDATEIATDRLDLSDQQSAQVRTIADEVFAEKDFFKGLRMSVEDEVLAQLKSDTADAKKLETVATDNLNQLRTKLPLLTSSFAKFHATLTAEQRAEIIEKMEKRKKRGKERGWGRSRKELTPERATERLADRLDLSDEQTTKVRPIVDRLFSEQDAFRKTHQTSNDEMLTLVKSDTVDATKLESVVSEKLNQLQSKLPLISESFAQLHAILTVEQRAEITKKLEDYRDRRENGRWYHWH